MAAIPISAIQLLEYANPIVRLYEACDFLSAFTHPRPSRSEWRFPLFGLLCAVLPIAVFAWGTAYKLSLYKTERNCAPAKVCTRGSDATKIGAGQVIDGRKVIGNDTASPPLVTFSIVLSGRHDVALSEACQVILSLPFWPIPVARPPPLGFFFS
jgi:hypothetical protein